MEERMNEVEIKNKPIKEVDINLAKVIKSICKIIYENKVGTGFLIKLYQDEKELKCIMTNEHIITKEMIELNKIIDIKYNNKLIMEKSWSISITVIIKYKIMEESSSEENEKENKNNQ